MMGIFLILGCSRQIDGNYTLLAKGYLGNTVISIKSNKSYEACMYDDMFELYSRGVYSRLNNRHIILKSTCDSNFLFLHVLNKSVSRSDSSCILIIQNPESYKVITIKDNDTFSLMPFSYIKRYAQQVYKISKRANNVFYLKAYCYQLNPIFIDLSYDTLSMTIGHSKSDNIGIQNFYIFDTFKVSPQKGIMIGKNETIIGQKRERKKALQKFQIDTKGYQSWHNLLNRAKTNHALQEIKCQK